MLDPEAEQSKWMVKRMQKAFVRNHNQEKDEIIKGKGKMKSLNEGKDEIIKRQEESCEPVSHPTQARRDRGGTTFHPY